MNNSQAACATFYHRCRRTPVLRPQGAQAYGWGHIDCIEVDDDPIAAELWEIAENLHRCYLSKEQRDQHIRRYAELIEAWRGFAKAIVAPLAQQTPRPVGIPRQIAEETGMSVDTVRRALNPAKRELVEVVDPYDAIIAQASSAQDEALGLTVKVNTHEDEDRTPLANVFCGWLPRCKHDLMMWRIGRVQSSVRPVCAVGRDCWP